LRSEQIRIDEQIKKLKLEKEKNAASIQQKEDGLKTLDKYNERLQTNGFNTPQNRKNGPNSNGTVRSRTISISSDEENAPIWERKWYKTK